MQGNAGSRGPPSSVPHVRPARSIRRSLAADESSNMLEVLQCDAGVKRPPSAQQMRVHNMGRAIKERVEVCQWIQNMTSDPSSPSVPSPVRLETPAAAAAVGQREVDITANATVSHVTATTATVVSAVAGGTGNVADGSSCIGAEKLLAKEAYSANAKPVADLLPTVAGREAVKGHCGEGEDSSYAVQLDAIRHQQLKLQEQERTIKEKMEKKQQDVKPATELAPQHAPEQDSGTMQHAGEASVGKAPSEVSKEGSVSSMDESRRRRLKGSLANNYARRDEGTVGSLIWSCDGQGEASVSSAACNSTSVSTTSARRQANLDQDDSSTISQLLSQTSFLGSPSLNGSERTVVYNDRRPVARAARMSRPNLPSEAKSNKTHVQIATEEQSSCASSVPGGEDEYDYSISTCEPSLSTNC